MVEESVNNSRKRKRQNSDIIGFSSDEFDVANTLITLLPSLYIQSKPKCLLNSCFQFSYAWVNKRRRSAVVNPLCRVALPPPSTAVATTVVKSFATSPDTPLGLSTSDSDNYNNKFDKFIKKGKEKLSKMIEERIQTQLTLKVGIEKVKQYLEKLMAQNCELKLERHKQMERKSAVNDTLQAGPSTSTVYNQQQPFISHHQVYFSNQTVDAQPYFGGYIQLGPRGFDLNVSAEEMEVIENGVQPLDQEVMIRNVMMNRAIAAQARRNRIVINKSKKVTRVR